MKDLYSIMGDVDDTEEAARERARIRKGRDRAEALEFAHRQAVAAREEEAKAADKSANNQGSSNQNNDNQGNSQKK